MVIYMAIRDYEQANTNISFPQAGSSDVDRSAIVIGAKAGRPSIHNWEGLRWSLMLNNPEYLAWFDDFLGDTVNATWQTNLSTGATAAINAQTPGVVRLTTDTDDNDFATLALGLNFTVSKGWTFFEARVASVTAITLRAIEVGLSDALSETAGLAFSNHSAAGVVDVADNAAIFGYDTDASMTAWAVNTVNAGTPAATALTAAPGTTFQKLGIAVNSDGDAYFFVDGTLVATHLLAVATTAILTPWISLVSLSGATKSIDIDYVAVAGTR